MSNLGGEY